MTNPSHTDSATSRPVALVTGAARRIGRAIAMELAQRGWALALHHRSSDEEAQALATELRESGTPVTVLQADLSSEAQTRSLAADVVAAFGHWDVVVNNASLFEYDSVETFSYDALDKHLRANTAAPVLLAHCLHAHLKSRPGTQGCVVNLLDQKLWNPNPDFLSYTLSKAALHAATPMLALALAPTLRVCGIAPGLTLTSDQITQEKLLRLQIAASPIQTPITPQDVAKTVEFILRNKTLTGSVIMVDAGQHLIRQSRDFGFM